MNVILIALKLDAVLGHNSTIYFNTMSQAWDRHGEEPYKPAKCSLHALFDIPGAADVDHTHTHTYIYKDIIKRYFNPGNQQSHEEDRNKLVLLYLMQCICNGNMGEVLCEMARKDDVVGVKNDEHLQLKKEVIAYESQISYTFQQFNHKIPINLW